MPTVTATQTDTDRPSPEDWRPAPAEDPAKERAAILESWGKDEDAQAEKPAKGKAPPTPTDDDEDEDLADRDEADEEDDLEDGDDKDLAKAESDDDKPDDSDLDDDDEDDDQGKADPTVAKGLARLQKQEQRMRQQLDRDREAARAELARDREALQAERAAAAETKAKYNRLAERAKIDPLGVLEELGLDDAEYVGKQAYARAKAATDPAMKEAAARLQRERERDKELAEVKRKLEEREKAETETKQQAEQRQRLDALLDGIATAAASVPKAELTARVLKADPASARSMFAQAHLALWQRDGVEPKPRAVIVEAEKMQRAVLRRYGIDPRTLAQAVATDSTTSGQKTAKPANGKASGKAVRRSDADELKRPTKEELLEEDWKL
jgi:hypothetical protein